VEGGDATFVCISHLEGTPAKKRLRSFGRNAVTDLCLVAKEGLNNLRNSRGHIKCDTAVEVKKTREQSTGKTGTLSSLYTHGGIEKRCIKKRVAEKRRGCQHESSSALTY